VGREPSGSLQDVGASRETNRRIAEHCAQYSHQGHEKCGLFDIKLLHQERHNVRRDNLRVLSQLQVNFYGSTIASD
jgi:hypothetical protein